MQRSTITASALALALCGASSAYASSVQLNFDAAASGATANSAAAGTGISFYQAHWVNDVDAYGDEIPNTEKFQIDAQSTADFPVTVSNPALSNYGPAPSGSNALDARDQPVLLHFASALNLTGFSLNLDNSRFGNLPPSSLYFLNASKAILATVNFDQTLPGLLVSLNTPLNGVSDVVLASGAFYDNITVSTVPVPAALPLMLSAMGLMGVMARRRKA